MNVLIADKESRVRSALRLFLEQQQPVNRVSEARDFSELKSQVLGMHPDILLLDWHLEDKSTAMQLATARSLEHDLKIVVLSLSDGDRYRALAAGADAFVCKSAPLECLLLALGMTNSTEEIVLSR